MQFFTKVVPHKNIITHILVASKRVSKEIEFLTHVKQVMRNRKGGIREILAYLL